MGTIKKWILNNSIKNHPNVHFNKSGEAIEMKKALVLGNYSYISEIRQLSHFLEESGIKTKTLAYSSFNMTGIDSVYTFSDLNWAGVPKSDKIEKRLSETFDICVFLDFDYNPHYKYILSLLMAEFVIGPDVKGLKEHFDLILEIKGKSIKKYFELVRNSLTTIG